MVHIFMLSRKKNYEVCTLSKQRKTKEHHDWLKMMESAIINGECWGFWVRREHSEPEYGTAHFGRFKAQKSTDEQVKDQKHLFNC